MSFEAGTAAFLTAHVRQLADMLPKTSGTIYVIAQVRDGSADDGKYWDTNAGGSWQATPTTLPTATHQRNGLWAYSLPSGASSGKAGAVITWYMTDNAATPASETASSAMMIGRLGPVPVNATQIGGDSTSADGAKAQFNGTGLVGGNYPATQNQVNNIVTTGAAVNRVATSYVLTTGTQSSGTYASTAAADSVAHVHTDDTGTLELYYQFELGSGIPTTATGRSYLTGGNDTVNVFAYNWAGATWDQIGTRVGGAASYSSQTYALYTSHVGTGANRGLVRIRYYGTGLTTATLAIDQLYVSYALVSGAYENGAIWIDTSLSNTNTVPGVDGISTNPVSTIAAALTLAAATNLKRFTIISGSSVTFAASVVGYEIFAHGATIALGGQDISTTHIHGAYVSGVATAPTGSPHFHLCEFNSTATLPAHLQTFCSWGGTITLSATGDHYFFDCASRVAGAGTPVIDLGAVGAQNLNIRRYSGGLTLSNIASGDKISVGGPDCGTITLNGADGEVDVRGVGKPVADNRTGSPTLTVTGHLNRAAIADSVWDEAIADHLTGGSTGATLNSASAPTAAAIADAVWDETLADHLGAGSTGAALNTATGGLTGASSVTLHTQEADTTTISYATITIRDATDTSVLGVVTTDSAGDVTIAIDDGTYKLHIVRTGYTWTSPTTLTVSGDATTNITGTVVTAAADAGAYESRPLRRQKIRYNSANTDTPLTYQRVIAGVKAVPSSATITIYAPGNSTALVSAQSMTVSGSLATYSPSTTTVASWPVDTGYRARIAATIGGVVYTDDIMFDVVQYILQLNIGVDQLVALDPRIASMEHAGDEDFSEPIEATRDELQARIEAKVIADKKLLENMILDSSRVAIPARYLTLANIYESKDQDQADRYRERFEVLFREVLGSIQYDDNQDLEESATVGRVTSTRAMF